MKSIIIFLAILCAVDITVQRSTPEADSYVAAVVEYQVQSNVETNLRNYINLIQDAASQNADIVVFPEMTLTRGNSVVIPIHGLLKENPIPALAPELYDEILVSISAAARQNEIYVVINVQEILNCTNPQAEGENCPEQKQYLFNTNVVFNRSGAVIDRYRKINLFGEFTRTPALSPDLGVFETDFGVTFGHYICFDLMFQVPAIQVVEKMNITDIVFSTMWFSEMPYLTAVQIQQAYAYSMNVNFLAAGANNPRVGSAGSGIYSGKAGALVSIMPGQPTTRLLVATVPKVPGEVTGNVTGPIFDSPSIQDNLTLITDPSLPSHQTRLLRNDVEDFVLFDRDVLCHFRVRMSGREGNMKYRYRASAFSGVRDFSGMATGGARVCAIFACTGDTIDTCGKRFDNYSGNTTVVFEQLEITAAVPTPIENSDLQASDSKYFPISLTTSIMPLKNEEFAFDEVSLLLVNVYSMKLSAATDELYAFGVWGRRFDTDGEDPSPPREHDVEDLTTTPAPATTPSTGSSYSVHKFSAILFIISIFVLLQQ
ncbi:vanin-like protein 2 isoform X1 [Danaus plexippus]|uniref:vanin-like protein 2 isoform X1 n=2 Tax=Danaus plexippus TaxID=13037 RepID=UPI002AB241A1|nr:vanin-like protein 2 isoform X1 [Danaus plexippus]